MTNRIFDLIASVQKQIDALDGKTLTGTPVEDVHADLALSLQEFLQFQKLQVAAHASGTLTPSEAMTVYRTLGGESYGGDWPKGTTLAAKVAITQLMCELLTARVGRRHPDGMQSATR